MDLRFSCFGATLLLRLHRAAVVHRRLLRRLDFLGDNGLMKGELTSGNINYIEFGVYNLRPEDSGSSLVNCPSSSNGTLIAFRPLGTYYIVQLYFASDNDKTVYYRLKTSDWWGWRRIQSVAM